MFYYVNACSKHRLRTEKIPFSHRCRMVWYFTQKYGTIQHRMLLSS